MSFLIDAVGSKVLTLIEEQLQEHEPALQALILAEMQSLGNNFITFVENKISSLENSVKTGS